MFTRFAPLLPAEKFISEHEQTRPKKVDPCQSFIFEPRSHAHTIEPGFPGEIITRWRAVPGHRSLARTTGTRHVIISRSDLATRGEVTAGRAGLPGKSRRSAACHLFVSGKSPWISSIGMTMTGGTPLGSGA